VLVAVALVLAYGVDRLVATAVERRVSATIGCRIEGAELTASLSGPLIAPRLLTGDLGTVTVQGTVGGAARAGTRIRLSLHDVHARPFSDDPVGVAGAEATVTLPYDRMRPPGTDAAQQRFENEDGRLAVVRSAAMGEIRVLMDLGLAGEEMVLTPTTVQVAGRQLPVDLVAPMLARRDPELAGQLEPRRIPLPDLPHGLVPDAVAAGPDGLALHASLDPGTLQPAGAAGCQR
jgi:hypothetical protein